MSGGQGATDSNSVVETGANEEGTSADSYYETPPVESCVDMKDSIEQSQPTADRSALTRRYPPRSHKLPNRL